MCGTREPAQLREILLFATGAALDEFPPELFFDDDLVWHQQQFGLPGHIASASLVLDGNRLYVTTLVSDIVQRISRRREYKTRLEKLFKGWPLMLWNAILARAAEMGIRSVYAAGSELVLTNTDRSRNPKPALYQYIYDRPPAMFGAAREGSWWAIDVSRALERVVVPEKLEGAVPDRERTICVCHDIEYGRGHTVVDRLFAREAEAGSPPLVDRMLAIEQDMGVTATYHVVGCLVPDLRGKIEGGGHCLAFHSYDHGPRLDQLRRCRRVDYRLKGYRVPQSMLTSELTDANLSFHNFEWLGNSAKAFGFTHPLMENGVVKIPILFDDFPLYRAKMPFAEWESRALERIGESRFVAFGLHDCYAQFWLPGYRGFLDQVKTLGTLRTLDQVAAAVTLAHAS
jgi:hypothetical protein